LPLGKVKLADPTLAHAVRRLDSAYRSFSSTDGAKGTPAATEVSAAEKAVNAICADAAP
jgi:HAMP domain-containing protein